jgi:hypothetical protein
VKKEGDEIIFQHIESVFTRRAITLSLKLNNSHYSTRKCACCSIKPTPWILGTAGLALRYSVSLLFSHASRWPELLGRTISLSRSHLLACGEAHFSVDLFLSSLNQERATLKEQTGTLHESRCLPAKSSHDSSFSPLFIHLSAFHLGYFAGPVWIGEGRRQSPFTSLAKHRPECMQRITGWSLCVLVLLPCWFPCVLAETACRRRQDGGNPRRRASSDEPRRVAKTSDGSLGWTAGYTRDPTDTVAGRRGPIRVEKVRRF